jgi:hypothetical protein
MCISDALCTLNSERWSSTFNSYSEGTGSNRGRITGCLNFLHRYSDVHFCVFISLPSWQYFKECPCGLLKLKVFFYNYPDRYFPLFFCVSFICILTRVSWLSLSLIFTVGLFCVFRNYPDRSSSFLFVFFHLYCDWRFSRFSLWLMVAELSWLNLFFFNFSIPCILNTAYTF